MASWPSWYPPLLALTQIIGSTLIIGFTPGDSIVRLVAFPGFTWLIFHFVSVCSSSIPGTFVASTASGVIAHFFLQYVEAAIVSKWDFKSNGPLTTNNRDKNDSGQPQERRDDSVWARFCFGFYVTCSCRYCGTRWEAKNVPPFFADDRSKIPTRQEFLKQSFRTLVIYFLIVDAISTSADPVAGAKWCNQSTIAFFSRIRDVSLEEVMFRVLTTVSFIGVSYLTVVVCFILPSIISVAMGMNEVSWWRPLFGSLGDAYTLRGFWGKFWHQMFRRRLTNIASMLTLDFLRLPKKSLIARYVQIFFVFLLSGFHHVVIDYGIGMNRTTSGAMRFYLTQVMGIILEDVFRALWARQSGARKLGIGQSVSTSRGEKIFGFVWVLLWLSWSYPATIYPTLEASIGSGDAGLPISIFKPVARLL